MDGDSDLALERGDLERLGRLRGAFLDALRRDGAAAVPDYWRDERDLELFDAFFGARIAAKWTAVLDEIGARAEIPDEGTVVDFGCGTGVASRAWLARAGASRVHVVDRAPLARSFAARRVRALRPSIDVREEAQATVGAPDVLLASHVLSELDARGEAALIALARRSSRVVWVEAGDRATSRRLGAARETLRATHELVAPCTHSLACGALATGRERDWCHFFARPDPQTFRSGAWRAVSEALGIDLRAIPYSFISMRARGAAPSSRIHDGAERVLGRARREKGCARFIACGAEGLSDLRFLERDGRARCRELCDPEGRALVLRIARAGDRALSLTPAVGSGGAPALG